MIPRVPSKMCWLVSVLEVILFATAVSSLCPEGAFSSVKESKETCITLHTVGKSTKVVLPHSLPPSAPYLIFVIFFTPAKFLENKIYTEKTRKLRQNTQKIANFLLYYGKIHSILPNFRVKSVKIYTGQKKFTREFSWLS